MQKYKGFFYLQVFKTNFTAIDRNLSNFEFLMQQIQCY